MAGRRAMVAVLAALTALLMLAACTGSPHPATTASTTASMHWRPLPLPVPGARIQVLAHVSHGLVALGSVPGPHGHAPAGWLTLDARHWQRFSTAPVTGYGEQAEFTFAGVSGEHIATYGLAYGGAHGNPRPTTWVGVPTTLQEHEQSFILFGGEDAISVNGEAAAPGRVLLVGQWDGRSGRYGAAVWLSPDGIQWTRYADQPQLTSAPGEQTAARGVAARGSGFVVVGDTLRGAGTQPLAWQSPDGRTWHRMPLPAHGDASAGRVGCDRRGCLVLGASVAARPHLLCWSLTPNPHAGDAGPAGGLIETNEVLLRDHDAITVQQVDGRARLERVSRSCTGWQSLPLPVTSRSAVVTTLGSHLLLATTDLGSSRLWLSG